MCGGKAPKVVNSSQVMCFNSITLILHDLYTLDKIRLFYPTGEKPSIEKRGIFVLRYLTSGVEALCSSRYKLMFYAYITYIFTFQNPTGFFPSFWKMGENKHWGEKNPVFFCKNPVGHRTSGVNMNNFETYFANKIHQNNILVMSSIGNIGQYSSAFYLKGTWVCEILDLQTQSGGRLKSIGPYITVFY